MVTFETVRKMALSYPETTEEPHFEKTSFRVKKTANGSSVENDAIRRKNW